MATIDDFGTDPSDTLNAPELGGPTGWAAAVRDYITGLPAQIAANTAAIAGKVSKAGDTITGPLTLPAGTSLRWPGADRMLYTNDDADALLVLNIAGGLATMQAKSPTVPDEVATKGYVDNMTSGVKWTAGTAVLSGAPTTDYNVPGLSSVAFFIAVNGDVNANSGQIVAVIVNAAGPGTVTMHHTFNGGAFRIQYMACGTP